MGHKSRVSRRLVGLVIVIVLFPLAGRSIAQVGTGTIIGQARDESGAVLPGVTVTATSPALQVPQVASVTDERGEYRLTPLPIGTYAVEYALAGFQTIRREGLRLTVGFTARVDIVMTVGGLEETVTVSGASPVVDATSTAAVTQLTRETLELIPTSRNGWIALSQATPGVRSSLDVGGSTLNESPTWRAFGQSLEPWQSLDGIPTVNPASGQSGNYMDYASFEEATIQTIGHDASVPNRGIVMNTVIKSGGNQFHGGAFFGGTNSNFEDDNIDAELKAQGVEQGLHIQRRYDVSAELGGRLVRNKLWFWWGSRYQENRLFTPLDCFQEDVYPTVGARIRGTTPCFGYRSIHFHTLKLTYQMSPANRLIGMGQVNFRDDLEDLDRFNAWDRRRNQQGFDGVGKVEWQNVKGDALITTVTAGGWQNHSGRFTEDLLAQGDFQWKTAARDRVTGERWGTHPGVPERNRQERPTVKGVVSWYKPDWFAGNHEIKGGAEWYLARANRLRLPRDPAAGNYELFFSRGLADRIQTFNTPVKPDSSIVYWGFFVQDSWTIARKLTLNLGLRHAYDDGHSNARCRDAAIPPGDVADPAACFPAKQFPIWHPWSPRLRAAFDLTGDGKTVVKGGWGRFHHMRTTNELALTDRNVIATTTYRWRDLNGNKNYDPGEVNLNPNGPDFINRTLIDQDGALANGQVNPNETEPWTDEYLIQFERELLPNFAMRVSGAYSRALNQYRVANPLRPYEAYNIPVPNVDPGPDGTVGTGDDPGTVVTYYDYPASLAGLNFQRPWLVNDDKANQTYRTIELAATKRLANRWQFMTSYSATKLNVQLVPNVAGGLSLGGNTQDPNSEIFAANKTWEWQFRASGSYLFGGGVLASASFTHQSGDTWARTVDLTGARQVGALTVRVEPIGTRRLPNVNLLDLRFEKTFSLGRGQRVRGRVDLANATNINTVLEVSAQSGPNFGQPTSIMLPRVVLFSALYTF